MTSRPIIVVLTTLAVSAGLCGFFWMSNRNPITHIQSAEISYAIPGDWEVMAGPPSEGEQSCNPTLRHSKILDDLGPNYVVTTLRKNREGKSLETVAQGELAYAMKESAGITKSEGSVSQFSSSQGVSGFNVRYIYAWNNGCMRGRFVNSNYFFLNTAGKIVHVRYSAEIFQPEIDAALRKSFSLH